MLIIGLAGQAGSGKSAVAEYLVQRYGFLRFSFSDALYAEVAAAFGLPDESLLRDRETKEMATPALSIQTCADSHFRALIAGFCQRHGLDPGVTTFSPRWVLQHWGTEYRRAQDPNYWVKQTNGWIWEITSAAPYPELRPYLFVNDSVRFENERQWVHALGGSIWHLSRETAKPVSSHESENPLPVWANEREIFNNHTLDYLHKGVDQLLTTAAKFVRLEPPAPMTEPVNTTQDEPCGPSAAN